MNYIFTTVYPGSEKFFKQFINSINSQTTKNFTLFIICNGINLSKKYMDLIKVNFLIFKINDTWQNARLKGLNFLLRKKVNFIIFADSDDVLINNRIEVILKKIKKNDFIVNNMYLFKKNINQRKIWLTKKSKKIKFREINYKNYIGCGNTAVRANALKKIHNLIDNRLIAFDWCMAKLLLINGFQGIYINKPLTLYRQYQNNTSSLTSVTKSKVNKDIKCKLEHFKFFSKFGIDYKKKIEELKLIKKKMKNKSFFIRNQKKFKKKNQNYWWAIV